MDNVYSSITCEFECFEYFWCGGANDRRKLNFFRHNAILPQTPNDTGEALRLDAENGAFRC